MFLSGSAAGWATTMAVAVATAVLLRSLGHDPFLGFMDDQRFLTSLDVMRAAVAAVLVSGLWAAAFICALAMRIHRIGRGGREAQLAGRRRALCSGWTGTMIAGAVAVAGWCLQSSALVVVGLVIGLAMAARDGVSQASSKAVLTDPAAPGEPGHSDEGAKVR